MQMVKWCTKQKAKIIVVKVKTVYMGTFLLSPCTVNILKKINKKPSIWPGNKFLKKENNPNKKTPCLFAGENCILTSNNKQ